MQLIRNTNLRRRDYSATKVVFILFTLILNNSSLYAQNKTIDKPQKKTSATTATTSTSSRTSRSTNYSEPTGYINGYAYVDLGLSVKWATCNVGASSPSDYGNYYAWGETSTKSEYTAENSKTYGKSMGNIAGNPQYDAARANWGGTWRLPTTSEISELINKCTWIWTTQGSYDGYKVTGANGNSIFLPATGSRNGTSLGYAGKEGYYWGATPGESDASAAHSLDFYDGSYLGRCWHYRYSGLSVRPVSD